MMEQTAGFDQNSPEQVARIKKAGKTMLKSDSLSTRQVITACYWKQGIPARHDTLMVEKMTKAIETRDLETLLPLIGNNSQNPGSEEAFSRITGVRLGKTQSERVAQLNEWAGQEKTQALKEKMVRESRLRESAREKQSMVGAWENLKSLQIASNGKVISGQEYIARKVAQGRDHVVSRKKGAVNAYSLTDAQDDVHSSVNDVRFTAFAKRVLAIDAGGDVRKAMEKAGIAHHLPEVEQNNR